MIRMTIPRFSSIIFIVVFLRMRNPTRYPVFRRRFKFSMEKDTFRCSSLFLYFIFSRKINEHTLPISFILICNEITNNIIFLHQSQTSQILNIPVTRCQSADWIKSLSGINDLDKNPVQIKFRIKNLSASPKHSRS